MYTQTQDLLTWFPFRTENLILRPVTQSDARDIHEQFTEEVALYMIPTPAKRLLEVEELVASWVVANALGINLQLTITDLQGEFLGLVGLHRPHTSTPEIGLWFKQLAQHRGYGSKVVRTLRNLATRSLDYTFLVYPVDRRNLTSRRLAEKMGGQIHHQYRHVTAEGKLLEILEYRIYP